MTIAVGTPAWNMYDSEGYVSRVIDAPGNLYSITAGGLQKENYRLEIVFPDHISEVSENIAAPWLAKAARANAPAASPDDVERMRAAAVAAQNAAREKMRADQEQGTRDRAAFLADAEKRMPAGAKAVIIANLCRDTSDLNSDYHGHTTTRTLILGFSFHTRDLFPELRKAALNHPETAALADAPESAEHREKYSMGAGYYLKAGWRDSDGWEIRKSRLYDAGHKGIPTGEWALTPPASAALPADPALIDAPHGVAITKHHHTKGGFDMWVATLPGRVERAEYERLLATAKALGGWYSRAWGDSPAGFAFKEESKARQFVDDSSAAALPASADPGTVAPIAAPISRPSNGAAMAAKLRELADRLQSDIDHKLGDRLTNTPKRMREAGNARNDGHRLQRTQKALRALAECHASGTVPADLAKVTTKVAVFDLCRTHIDSRGGYYDAGIDTGRPAVDSPAARALWAMFDAPSAADRAAAELRAKVEKLQFANIPGYFPTPAGIVARMIRAARIPAGGCSVLEPSAGSGAILDAIRADEPDCTFQAYERHCSLAEILKLKGYELAGADFMESDLTQWADRVLMNPPFENGADAIHIMRAFRHLAPGGRLIAIMSPGPFYRSDSKSREWREWFDRLGGERLEDIPAGAFKESGTGVATVMVQIDNDGVGNASDK